MLELSVQMDTLSYPLKGPILTLPLKNFEILPFDHLQQRKA